MISFIVFTTAACSSLTASGPFMPWLMREMTSAPNGAWPLSVELTAAAMPVRKFMSVPTRVVVPTSNAMP